jgi:hypothetical protein
VSAASAQLLARIGAATIVIAGLTLVAAGLPLTIITGEHSSWALIMPGHILACIGTGLFNPAIGTLALGAASGADSGQMAGVNDVVRQGGMALGVAAFGALVPAAAALGAGDPEAYVAGLHHALLIGAAIALAVAGATAILIGRRPTTVRLKPTFPPRRQQSLPNHQDEQKGPNHVYRLTTQSPLKPVRLGDLGHHHPANRRSLRRGAPGVEPPGGSAAGRRCLTGERA